MIEPTRLCPHTIVPRHVCAHTRLCPHTFVPTHVCAHTRLCPHTIVPTHDCAHTRLCPHTFVPTHVCTHTSLFPHMFVPKSCCQNHVWAETCTFVSKNVYVFVALMCLGTACMCTFMLAQSCQLTGYKLRKKPTEDLCSGNKLLVLFF